MIRTRPSQHGSIRDYNISHKHNTLFFSEREKERCIYKYIDTLNELGVFDENYTYQQAYNSLKRCEDKNRMSQIFITIRDKGGT